MRARVMRTAWAAVALVSFAGIASGEDAAPAKPAPAAEAIGFWTPEELARIDLGLEVLNLDRKDLGFQKRLIDDPFRLRVVNRVLDDPLSIGSEAEAWDRVARQGTVVGIVEKAAAMLVPAPLDYGDRMSWYPDLTTLPTSFRPQAERVMKVIAHGDPWLDFLSSHFGDRHDSVIRKALLSQVESPSISTPGSDLADEAFLKSLSGLDQNVRETPLERALYLLSAVGALVDALKVAPDGPRSTSSAEIRISTKAGAIVVSGTGDDVHDEGDDVVLVIDLGGNDIWKRGASAYGKRPVSVCIDLAGDDHYVGRQDLSFGGALGGVAIQWDCGGHDVYEGGNCSCGAGILGVGVLVDEGGDDVYRVKDFGLGAGAYGIGVLLEKAGNDTYHDDLYGEGFGSTWGCGVLVDLDGHDSYDAGGVHSDAPLHRDRTLSLSQGFAIGNRPDASGGVGVLVDVKGNDRYAADIYGQGASYWFSLGLLIDDDGNDTYTLGHYGQGAGIHLSAGMLLDRAGQDLYFDEYGVGIGGAHDFAVGILVDRGGDDHYVGSGGSQGGALTNSVAILMDDAGNDEYTAARPGASHGAATPARDTGGIGLLLDGGGKDVYSEYEKDGRIWTSGTFGAGIDEPSPPEAAGADPMGAAITPEAAKALVDREGRSVAPFGVVIYDDLDKLWEIAKRWQVGDERVIGPIARARLVAMGKPALDRAIERIGSKDGLEYECVSAILSAMPKETVVPRLLDATRAKDAPTRKAATRMLGTLKAAEAEPRLVELLADDDARRFALGALGALGKAPPQVIELLKSKRELDGVAAAACLGAAAEESAWGGPSGVYSGPGRPAAWDRLIDSLASALSPETPFLVRIAAEGQLANLGDIAVESLENTVRSAATSRERRSAIRAMGLSKSRIAAQTVTSLWSDKALSTDRWVRFELRRAATQLIADLAREDTTQLAAALASSLEQETDPLLLRLRVPPPPVPAPRAPQAK